MSKVRKPHPNHLQLGQVMRVITSSPMIQHAIDSGWLDPLKARGVDVRFKPEAIGQLDDGSDLILQQAAHTERMEIS